jgi:hypothetical protein
MDQQARKLLRSKDELILSPAHNLTAVVFRLTTALTMSCAPARSIRRTSIRSFPDQDYWKL